MTEPRHYGYRELPADEADARRLFRDMAEIQRTNGAVAFRFTIISDEYPKPPYPQGLYVEGWEVDPNPYPPFNFPLTAVEG